SGTTVVANVPVGAGPVALAYDSENGDLYVVNEVSDNVSVISGTTVVANVPVGAGPVALAYDSENGDLYVVNELSDNVSVISGTTVVASLPVGVGPDAVAYDSGNGYIYVANCGALACGGVVPYYPRYIGNVTVISGTTAVASIPIGLGSDAMVYDSGNGYVYVATCGGLGTDCGRVPPPSPLYIGNVTVISGTTAVTTVEIGFSPVAIAYDDGNGYVYVALANSDNVSVISGDGRGREYISRSWILAWVNGLCEPKRVRVCAVGPG
ncbi:YVTN beta-propeller repeat-containing protein, partial [mine drainage metagenome]